MALEQMVMVVLIVENISHRDNPLLGYFPSPTDKAQRKEDVIYKKYM